VLARLRGLLRRAKIARAHGDAELAVSGLTIDEDAREVRRAGKLIELTATATMQARATQTAKITTVTAR
jgi:two-component system, OmpR family, response regulator